MIENLGVCKGLGDILCQIRVGSDNIYVSKIGRHLYSLLNNRIIMMAKSKKELLNQDVPVLSHIIKNLSKKAQVNSIGWRPVDKRYTEMITETIKNISKNLKPVEIYLLESKPDETQDNRSILANKRDLVSKLEDYCLDLIKFRDTLDNIEHASRVLLKTNLDRKIWGSKEVMSVLNGVKLGKESLLNDFDTIDGCLEQSDNQVHKIKALIINKISSDLRNTAGKIIENFSTIKSFLSRFAQVLQRLYGIDNDFRTRIGYPATWFLNGSIFQDFLFEYDNLIGHIIKSASIESGIIEPLLIWKIKLTGVK